MPAMREKSGVSAAVGGDDGARSDDEDAGAVGLGLLPTGTPSFASSSSEMISTMRSGST